jgi:hypothetical protein
LQLIRLLAIVAAGVAATVGYVHERRRLDAIKQLPGPTARDYYEAGRARNDRAMWVIAAASVFAAVTFIIRTQVAR